MDVGETLRRARVRKRLTLEQIAQSTKIHVATLEALETNDFDRLPASIYTRGFLRAFAREVDLDPEETVEQYMEQCEAMAPTASMTPSPDMYQADETSSGTHQRTIVIPRFLGGSAFAVAIFVLAGVAYFGMMTRQNAEPVVTSTAEAATEAPQPAPVTPPESDVARAANVEAESLKVELTATGPCWVSATTDRETALSRLLQAGEKHELNAKDELVLRVGDPGTLTISVNGIAGRPLGRAGQPITVQINRQNYREFQQS